MATDYLQDLTKWLQGALDTIKMKGAQGVLDKAAGKAPPVVPAPPADNTYIKKQIDEHMKKKLKQELGTPPAMKKRY